MSSRRPGLHGWRRLGRSWGWPTAAARSRPGGGRSGAAGRRAAAPSPPPGRLRREAGSGGSTAPRRRCAGGRRPAEEGRPRVGAARPALGSEHRLRLLRDRGATTCAPPPYSEGTEDLRRGGLERRRGDDPANQQDPPIGERGRAGPAAGEVEVVGAGPGPGELVVELGVGQGAEVVSAAGDEDPSVEQRDLGEPVL